MGTGLSDLRSNTVPPTPRVSTLKSRRDFLALRSGQHWSAKTLVLQARKRDDETGSYRVGYTITTKVGNSVVRNRIKRRLREAVQRSFPANAKPGHDYALIGKRRALGAKFESIVQDLNTALDRVHQKRENPANHRPKQD